MSEFVIKIGEPEPKATPGASDYKVFVSREELKSILKDYRLKPGYTFDEVFPEFQTQEKIFIDERFLGNKLSYFQGGAGGGGIDDLYPELNTENKTIIGAINEIHGEIDAVVPRVDVLEFNVGKIMENGALLPDIIDVAQLKANSVVADKIEAGAITTEKIRADSIIAEQIKVNQIKTDHLQANSVVASKIAADQINAGHIQADAIETKHIKADQIVAKHIAADAITSEKIMANQILARHILADQIHSNHIAANQIDAVHINSDTIETRHIKADQIVAEHILSDQIETRHLKADSIDANKIQANAIATKHLTAGAVVADKIAANAITSDKIEANAVTTDKIHANSIETYHLNGKIITGDVIQAGAITAGSGIIANGAIGNAQISDLEADKINAGTIDTNKVKISSKDAVMEMYGNQILINDTTDALKPQNRVILGEYSVDEQTTEFGLLVRGKDGQTVMIDGAGVHNAGITDGAIDNNKVADDANISGLKLDIDSVIRTVNENGTETISGTKVQVGDKTLNVELSEQSQLITANKEEISNQKTQMLAMEDSIKLKVDNQTYEKFEQTITGKVEELENSIPFTVEVVSTNGNIFKNGNIATTLTVVVKEGNVDITDTVQDSQVLWSRISADPQADELWNIAHVNAGKTIEVTSMDFIQRAIFKADVMDLGIRLLN